MIQILCKQIDRSAVELVLGDFQGEVTLVVYHGECLSYGSHIGLWPGIVSLSEGGLLSNSPADIYSIERSCRFIIGKSKKLYVTTALYGEQIQFVYRIWPCSRKSDVNLGLVLVFSVSCYTWIIIKLNLKFFMSSN